MNSRLFAILSFTLFTTFIFSGALAQLPTCGMVYGISTAIYNYDPTKPVSSTNPAVNTISVPSGVGSGSLGLTVCPILGSTSSTLTFYSLIGTASSGFNYAYYDAATSSWVNTGHSLGSNAAVNIAAGGGYIYSLEGGTGKVYKYDGTGNATLLITVPGFRGASPYDLVADCDGNWYILNYNGAGGSSTFLRKYSPAGSLLQSWVINNPYSLSASPAAGFGINGNILYTDTRNGSQPGVAFYTLGSTALQLDSIKLFPSGINAWIDIGTCASAVPSIPLVTITASGNNGCIGDTVSFSTSTISGGSAPVFQWKVNGSNVGTNSPTFQYVPSNGDVVTCVMTSNSICATPKTATSNPITLNVLVTPVTPAISIAASGNGSCVGIPVNLTASISNGGTAPAYQWSVNGVNVGSGGSTYTYTPALGDTVRCVLTSTVACVTSKLALSNPVVMNVIAITPAVSISSPSGFSCSGDTVLLAAAPVNGGTSPAYQWKVNGSSIGANNANFSYAPANGDVVTCVLTSNANCLTAPSVNSNLLTMMVIGSVVPSLSVSASDTGVCTGTTVIYTATPSNGGTVPGYHWSVNGSHVGTNNASYSYTPRNGDTIACVLSSSASCANPLTSASNPIIMSVGPQVIPGINVNTNPPIVGCEGTPILFVTNIVAGGPAPKYQWYRNGIALPGATSPTYLDNTLKNGDTIRATLISSAPCPSTPITWSNHVGLNLSLPVLPVITIAPTGPIPAGLPQLFTASITGGGLAPTHQWRKNGVIIPFATGATYTVAGLSAGDVISASLLSNDLCATQSIVKSNDVQVSGTTGIGSTNKDWSATLYPNPNTGTFTLSMHERSNVGGRRYSIDVINSVGQSLYHNETGKQSSGIDQLITLPGGIPAGGYFLRVRADEGASATIPFLIVR